MEKPVKIEELIEYLQTLPRDLEVWTTGEMYEFPLERTDLPTHEEISKVGRLFIK